MPDRNAFENDFFGVLEDLSAYLGDLTLVGGWVPYIYAAYLWRGERARPVFTSDVDWGLVPESVGLPKATVFKTLSALAYSERHLEIGKLQPVVFYRKNKTRLDFIVPAGAGDAAVGRFLGSEIAVSKLDDFQFLLENRMVIPLKRGAKAYALHCPKPSAFVLHKCATFTDRDDPQKKAKDLYYAYFILRHAPDQGELLKQLRGYADKPLYKKAAANIKAYFQSETSRGCVMVEKEHGPDDYIEDLPADIFRRFAGVFGG